MTNELYQIISCQEEADSITCTIRYNRENAIFSGHFPGNPIVPGVCTMQLVMDLLQRALQTKLRLIQAPNVKFLQLITPDTAPTARITWATSGHTYAANATLLDGSVTLFKMTGTYISVD